MVSRGFRSLIHRKHLRIIIIFLLLVASFAGLLTLSSHAVEAEYGWDFEDHTYNHTHLTKLTDAEIVSQLGQSSAAFQTHGLPIPEHLAYPYGEFDQHVIDVVSQYRKTGRTAGGSIHFPETYPVADWYRMSAANFCPDYSWDQIRGWIDTAITQKALLNLFTHQVVENPPRYSSSPAMLAQILDYLVAKRDAGLLNVMTLKKAYNSFDGTKAIVVISFDDGWASVYTTAWPMFKARGLVGTCFLCAYSEDHSTSTMLTWIQISEMFQATNSPPDKPTDPNPVNGATGVPTSVTLSTRVSDPEGDPMNVSFYQSFSQQGAQDFTIVVLPDTQHYSASYPWIFDNQTRWIANNVRSMNIVFVTHEGDIVDDYTVLNQWINANNSMSKLDGYTPWGVLPGNHDSANVNLINYNKYFSYARFNGQTWYGGGYQNTDSNSFQLFHAREDDYLILHLQYAPTNAILAWANSTLASYPNRRVIVATHSYLTDDGSRTTEGAAIWDKFVKFHADQIFLVLCGHYAAPGTLSVAKRTDLVNGHTVYQLLADYQYYSNQQSGLFRILKFSPALDEISVKTYSPYTNTYLTDSNNQFTIDYDMTYSQPTQSGLIGTATNVPSGEVASIPWNGLTCSTIYQWYAVATDIHGASRQSDTWTFITTSDDSLPSASISPSSVTMCVGQSQQFTSVVSGGTTPYSYQWYLDGEAVPGATSSTWTYTPPASGVHTVYLKITDHAEMQTTSNNGIITVNGQLSVTISPSSVTRDLGQSQLFTSIASGGILPYAYQWCLNGVAVAGATGSTWTFTPSATGSYFVYVNVTDNFGFRAKSNIATATINPTPSVAVSPASITLRVGQSQLFTSIISGGTGPYSYQWYLKGKLVLGATNPTWTFTPSSPSSYTVYVRVTDSVGVQVASNTIHVRVLKT